MRRFYRVNVPENNIGAIAADLRSADGVNGAYIVPPGVPPLAYDISLLGVGKTTPPPSTSTPSFFDKQAYLRPPPSGLGLLSWSIPGARATASR